MVFFTLSILTEHCVGHFAMQQRRHLRSFSCRVANGEEYSSMTLTLGLLPLFVKEYGKMMKILSRILARIA